MRHLAITTLKCRKDLTTASSEVKKDEGEVEAPSAIREARNLDSHVLRRERQWLFEDPSPEQGVETLRGRRIWEENQIFLVGTGWKDPGQALPYT